MLRAVTISCWILLLLHYSAAVIDTNSNKQLNRVKRIIGKSSKVTNYKKESEFAHVVTLHGHVTTWNKLNLYLFSVPTSGYSIYHHCGASIIDQYHVITAAHCVVKNNKIIADSKWLISLHGVKRQANFWSNIGGWISTNYQRLTGIQMNLGELAAYNAQVTKVFVHPEYTSEKSAHDIAILRTTGIQLSASRTRPIQLPPPRRNKLVREVPAAGTECRFAGWGCVQLKGKAIERLLSANLRIVSPRVCGIAYGYINEGDLCVRGDGTTICKGDSGGGLTCNDNEGRQYLAGVASSAADTSNPTAYPANFVDVGYYSDWISSSLRW